MRKKTSKTVQERAEEYVKEEKVLLKKHKIAKKILITFPANGVPLMGKIAGWLLKRTGARIETMFMDKK